MFVLDGIKRIGCTSILGITPPHLCHSFLYESCFQTPPRKSPHKDRLSEPPEPASAMRYTVQTSYPFPFLLLGASIRHVQNACNCGSLHAHTPQAVCPAVFSISA